MFKPQLLLDLVHIRAARTFAGGIGNLDATYTTVFPADIDGSNLLPAGALCLIFVVK